MNWRRTLILKTTFYLDTQGLHKRNKKMIYPTRAAQWLMYWLEQINRDSRLKTLSGIGIQCVYNTNIQGNAALHIFWSYESINVWTDNSREKFSSFFSCWTMDRCFSIFHMFCQWLTFYRLMWRYSCDTVTAY